MGNVTQMITGCEAALAAALQASRDLNASGVIVILIHGDDLIHEITDRPYRFARYAGYLEAAKGNGLAECLSGWEGGDEPSA